jgi:exodeoxyribonuclease VII small subunit
MTSPTPKSDAQTPLDLDSASEEAVNFETLFGRLETTAAQLQDGKLTLDQSVALYEQGMEIAERCQALLTDVEQRIEILRQRANRGEPQ